MMMTVMVITMMADNDCDDDDDYWRASVASETLTGVKMKKSGMFVYLFIYMDVRMSFCTLTLRIFVFAPRSTPNPPV